MQEPKVSLVFPCWHAARHMHHVLEDLQAQTFKDFEAILVNDGDDSQIKVMEEIAAKDCRIRIVNLEQNSGVAAARNAGTDAATSEWVTYPDPDDHFGPDYVKSLFEAVEDKDVQMACGGYITLYMSNKHYENHQIEVNQSPEITDIVEGYNKIITSYAQCEAWNKLYSIELIKNKNLKQNTSFINGQDCHFNYTYFPFVKRVGLVKNCGYLYHFYEYDTNRSRYNPFYMENHIQIINLQNQFHKQIGRLEQQITDERNTYLTYSSFRMCCNLFSKDSPLTISDATAKIKEEIFNQPEIINAILTKEYGKDRIIRIYRYLISKKDAKLLAFIIKMLVTGKRCLGTQYANMRHLLWSNK